MKLRSIACLIGALAISSAPFVLAVTGGGLPSSPIFSSARFGSGLSAVSAGQVTIGQGLGVGGGGNGTWDGFPGDINAAGTITGQTVASNGAISAATSISASTTITATNGIGVSCSPGTNKLAVCSTAGNSALIELAGNGTTAGTSSVAVGSDAGGVAQFGNRNSGANSNLFCTGTCTLNLTGTTIATTATTVPWGKAPCIIKITFSGTTPSVNSSTGCASPSVTRGSTGSYTFTDANITGLIGLCTPNSSSGGPYLQMLVSIGGGSALVDNFSVPGTASVLADIPSGASLTCRFDR